MLVMASSIGLRAIFTCFWIHLITLSASGQQASSLPPSQPPTQPPQPPAAFSVAKSTPTDTASSSITILFDKVFVNQGDDFDNFSSQFNAPEDGLYVFMFTTKSAAAKASNVVLLHNGKFVVNAYARVGNYMASNQVVLQLKMFDSVWLELKENSNADSSNLHTMTFSGHFIYSQPPNVLSLSDQGKSNNGTIYPAFTAVKTSRLVAGASPVLVKFDQVITNAGLGYSESSGQFKAVESGLYMFMVSGVPSSGVPTLRLKLNGQTIITPVAYYIYTTCMRVILPLQSLDSVWVELAENTGITNASFTGYFISKNDPGQSHKQVLRANSDPVVFSVGREKVFETGTSPATLVFDKLYTNEGLGFDIGSSHFHAPVDGVYVFVFNSRPNKPHTINLFHNGALVMGMTGANRYYATMNNVVLSLKAFDNVWLEMQPSGSTYATDSLMHTTFAGYLLD